MPPWRLLLQPLAHRVFRRPTLFDDPPPVLEPLLHCGPTDIGPVYELKYAFLYGYNGTTFTVPGMPIGVHTGDLEHVTIRVDATRMMCVHFTSVS